MTKLADARDEDVFMSPLALDVYLQKYCWKDENGRPTEVWPDTAWRVCYHVLGAIGIKPGDDRFDRLYDLIVRRKFLPGGRYLAMAGREIHPVNNCFLYRCEDSREGWGRLHYKAEMALTMGGGVGVVYSDVREAGAAIKKTGGVASGPLGPMNITNEIGRWIVQGGTRRSAIWAGLHWWHEDISQFIRLKDWSPEVRRLKDPDQGGDPDFPAPMDKTNISVILDDEFFVAYDDPAHPRHQRARDVYLKTIEKMVRTGEPGFSIDVGENAGESLRNACTEICSRDDSDVCNLGSINLGRVDDVKEFAEIVDLATLFLLAGTVYSDVPHEEVLVVREKNRRLGLGLMGIHEWLIKRGYPYGPCDELATWLDLYARSGHYAGRWCDQLGLSHPVKTRAIAPNGTIAIEAETTSGIESILCVAGKRTFYEGYEGQHRRLYRYVIHPVAERLIEEGVDPDDIEDAYSIPVERRLEFQAWVQRWVDHGISSTLNLPRPITDPAEVEAFGDMLYPYLPRLRGVTCYPDGARGGQPFEPCSYEEAEAQGDALVDVAEEERCAGGACGI